MLLIRPEGILGRRPAVHRRRRIILDASIAAVVVLIMGALRGVYSNELMLFNFIVSWLWRRG